MFKNRLRSSHIDRLCRRSAVDKARLRNARGEGGAEWIGASRYSMGAAVLRPSALFSHIHENQIRA